MLNGVSEEKLTELFGSGQRLDLAKASWHLVRELGVTRPALPAQYRILRDEELPEPLRGIGVVVRFQAASPAGAVEEHVVLDGAFDLDVLGAGLPTGRSLAQDSAASYRASVLIAPGYLYAGSGRWLWGPPLGWSFDRLAASWGQRPSGIAQDLSKEL
ncbi:MAG: hypothetical protein QN130_12345 [Armatimonadota bacterium]|nr:hypothetical protein [Armatimonadota bacterium]